MTETSFHLKGQFMEAVTSKLVPGLVLRGPASTACAFVRGMDMNGGEDVLPEALVLFNASGLSAPQRKEMVKAVFPRLVTVTDEIADGLADCHARIGRYGFSFPQWRFVMKGFPPGPSLAELFGMKRQDRPSDVRDPALPKSDPERDEFGTGFVSTQGGLSVEYRRAYILCADRSEGNEAVLVIRNSSRFFGRDRLPSAAFVSWNGLTREALEKLDAESFSGAGGPLLKWRDAFRPGPDGLRVEEKVRRVQRLLDRLDGFDRGMSAWLRSREGAPHLADYVTFALLQQEESGRRSPPFYLAGVDERLPPWAPVLSVPVNAGVLADLDSFCRGGPCLRSPELAKLFAAPELKSRGMKMLLLSGPHGDLPVSPRREKGGERAAPPSPAP